MKVYNQEKTQILTEYDLSKGNLILDMISINVPEIKAVEEQGHYETIAEYPNGGKDVKWVVDVQGVEYQPATTKNEAILVYVPYTEQELAQQEIISLKEWFDTFYTQHEQKYRRLISLDKLNDDGISATSKLRDLYLEAEQKRARIQELENIGGSNG